MKFKAGKESMNKNSKYIEKAIKDIKSERYKSKDLRVLIS